VCVVTGVLTKGLVLARKAPYCPGDGTILYKGILVNNCRRNEKNRTPLTSLIIANKTHP
jgi:hypothetical protein